MAKESCDTCKFFMDMGGGNGICRRYPASVVVHPAAADKNGQPLFAFAFPSMNGRMGWCGESDRRLIIEVLDPSQRQL